MIITGMNHFQRVCLKKLVEWYHNNYPDVEIDLTDTFVVWRVVRLCRIISYLLLQQFLVMEFMQNIHIMVISKSYMRMYIRNLQIVVLLRNNIKYFFHRSLENH